MKILLTGTGAADGIPAFYAHSRVSEYARKHGGKDVRLRAGAVIDDVMKLDFGPDTLGQAHKFGLSISDWKYIVFTHSHDDHFAPKELQYMFPPFVAAETCVATVYGNEAILDGICDAFEEAVNLNKRLIRSFETVYIGDYEVTPIRAYHKLDEDSMNLIVKGDRTLLYAVDTGIYQAETWEFLKGWVFDAVVIESTDGFNTTTEYWGHLSCEACVGVVERLRGMGCVRAGTRVITTHHSHAGEATHAELEEYFSPRGIEVGFDGLLIEV